MASPPPATASPPPATASPPPPSAELVELVRDATRRVLPMVDIETVTEREVVGMVEHRMGVLVAGDETLRSAVQGEIDAFLLRRDDPATEAERAPPNPAAKRKRRKSPPLAGFVVPDDASDGDEEWDAAEEADLEEEDEDDAAPRRRADKTKTPPPGANARTAAARAKWSYPAPAPGPAAPAAAAPGASAAPAAAASLEDRVASSLGADGRTAKDLARVLKANKSDVNKALYKLQSAGRAAKADAGGGAPTWTATGGVRGGAPGVGRLHAPGRLAPPASVKPDPGASASTAGASASTAAGGDAVPGQICALSRSRRCVVSEYRGTRMVSFREYYEKESAWLPGKKGISLRREQWTALAGLIPSVDAKIAEMESSAGGGDASGSSESVTVGHLSETRRVTVGTFRGAVTVGVREYYRRDDDGPWLPGKKGIALAKDQWRAVCQHRDAIERALGPGGETTG